jgi:hypothetical protein
MGLESNAVVSDRVHIDGAFGFLSAHDIPCPSKGGSLD